MKNYKKEELIEIIKSPKKLENEIKHSWGSIFFDFENNNILPKKEDLLGMKDAAVLPFLFKNYFIESNEIEEIKGLISLFENRSGWMDKDVKELKESPLVEEELKDLNVQIQSENDFGDYSVVFNSISNNKSIPYIPDYHNIKLLERLHKDNVPILFSPNDYDESLNMDWMLNIIVNTSVSEFSKISPDLALNLVFFLREGEYTDSHFTDLIKIPHFLTNMYKNYEYLSFSDLGKYGTVGVPEDVVYEVIGKILQEEKKDSTSPSSYLKLDLNWDLYKSLSHSFNINKIKSVTENRIVAFWDKNDLSDVEIRRNFLKKIIPYGSGMIYDSESYYKLSVSDFSNVFTKDDALNYFNNVYQSKNNSSFSLNRNLNLANLQNNKVTHQQMDIISHLVAAIYPDVDALNAPMDINKMVISILKTLENDKWGTTSYNSEGLNLLLGKVVDRYNTPGVPFDYNLLSEIYPLMKKHPRLFYPFFDKITQSFKENKSVDAAVLCYMNFKDFPSIYDMKDSLFNNLNPVDIQELREMGFEIDSSVLGTKETPISKDNVFSRLIAIKGNFDTDFLDIALNSSSFRQKMKSEFKLSNETEISHWLLLSDYINKKNRSFIIELIKDEFVKNPSLLKSIEDKLFVRISNEKSLKEFLPEKQKMSYKTFLSSHEMIKEIEASKPKSDSEFANKIEKIRNELRVIPDDSLYEYAKKMIISRDWEKNKIPHSLLTPTIAYLMNGGFKENNLNKNDLFAIFNNLNENFSSIYINFMKTVAPSDLNENKATVLCSILNFNLSKDNYSINYDNFSHLLENNKSKIEFFKALELFPKLILNNSIFNMSYHLTDEKRVDLLKNGLKNLNLQDIKETKFLLNGEKNIFKEVKNNVLSHDFIDLLKKEDFSIFEKIILTQTTKNMVRSYLNIDEFIDLLKGANVCNSQLENEIRMEFKLIPGDGYLSSDEKFQCLNVLSHGCLFPELLNKNFIKDNSKEFAHVSATYDFSFNYGLVDTFYANKQYVDVTYGIEDIISNDVISISAEDNLLNGIILFAEKKLKADTLNHLHLSNEYFTEFMEIIISGEKIKSLNSTDDEFKKYKMFACSNILAKAFIEDNLSDENKEKLLNAVKMSYISSTLFDGSILGGFGKSVLSQNDVLDNATIYQNKKNIQNIFTNFSVDYLSDDNFNNDFKI